MATGPSTPQASNVFIPNFEASGRLAVGFSRNPKLFKIGQYVQYVKSPKIKGYYLKFTNQNQNRIIDKNRYVWPYGDPRPRPLNPETFNFIPFELIRRAYPYGLDEKTVAQADFKVLEVERNNKATLAMTARTDRAVAVLTTTANWQTSADADLSANHTDTATNLGGGKWDVGTDTAPYIQKSINKAMSLINKDTAGVIDSRPESFRIVMNPDDAALVAASPEYHAFLKGSPSAYAEVTGKLHPNAAYGLPSALYGVELCIENAVKVTSEAGDTLARSYEWPSNKIAILARQGELEGVYGEQSFSTFTIFHDWDLLVEEWTDEKDHMTEGRVAEETVEVLTCPASGYLITSATA